MKPYIFTKPWFLYAFIWMYKNVHPAKMFIFTLHLINIDLKQLLHTRLILGRKMDLF